MNRKKKEQKKVFTLDLPIRKRKKKV